MYEGWFSFQPTDSRQQFKATRPLMLNGIEYGKIFQGWCNETAAPEKRSHDSEACSSLKKKQVIS